MSIIGDVDKTSASMTDCSILGSNCENTNQANLKTKAKANTKAVHLNYSYSSCTLILKSKANLLLSFSRQYTIQALN